MHRSDGSGTTFNFTYYLADVSADWKSKVGHNTSVEWPVGIGAKGNEGVANNVANTKNSIGYVEYAYALQNKLTYTKMMNKDGKTVAPTSEAFQAAAANADWKSQPGYGVILANQPGANSWPMTAATWILIYKKPVRPGGHRLGAEVLRLVLQERRQDGRKPRLRADAGQRRRRRSSRPGRTRSRARTASPSSRPRCNPSTTWEKAPPTAPFPCPPPPTGRLALRPAGRLSGLSAPLVASMGEPDATRGEARRG